MSTALVSFYDFPDHCSYRTKSDRKSVTISNGVAPSNGITSVGSRRVLSNCSSVPIGVSHSSPHHRLPSNSSPPTVSSIMQPKGHIMGTNGQSGAAPPVTLVRGLSVTPCIMNNVNGNSNNNNKDHKKLDRSMSEPAEKRSPTTQASASAVSGPMSSRYKTELCRSFAEVGTCKYGDKCQFAHGAHELRNITRHPKFKTENCKSFHSTGFCPYGPRCHFIHNSEESKKNILNNLQQNGGLTTNGITQQTRICNDQIISGANIISNNSVTNNGFPVTYHSTNNSIPQRPKALSIGSYSLGSSGEISPPSSQSGSPTSLNSFFTEDPFNQYASSTNTSTPCANNAFSFSPDFASLVASPNNKLAHNNNGLTQTFGGSQPSLCAPFHAANVCDQQVQVTLYSRTASPPVHTNGTTDMHSPPPGNLTSMVPPLPPQLPPPPPPPPVQFPAAPASPVDSVASEVDALRLEPHNLSPIPTCSPPLGKTLPRLPIFTRFAMNSNNGNGNNELD